MELLVLSQTHCGKCRELEAWLDNEKEARDFDYTKINIDDQPEAIAAYGIMSTPVSILIEDGMETVRVMGFNDKVRPDLETLLDEIE